MRIVRPESKSQDSVGDVVVRRCELDHVFPWHDSSDCLEVHVILAGGEFPNAEVQRFARWCIRATQLIRGQRSPAIIDDGLSCPADSWRTPRERRYDRGCSSDCSKTEC